MNKYEIEEEQLKEAEKEFIDVLEGEYRKVKDEELDIPEVKKTIFEKLKDKFKKKEKEISSNDIPEIKESKLEILKKWYKSKKNSSSTSPKSLFNTIMSGAITSVSVAGSLVTASMSLSIGLLPTLAITSCYVVAAGMAGYIFKEELNNLKENKVVNKTKNKKEVNSNDIPEVKESKLEKLGKYLKQNLNKSKQTITEKIETRRQAKEERKKITQQEKEINFNDIPEVKESKLGNFIKEKIETIKKAKQEIKELRKQEKENKKPKTKSSYIYDIVISSINSVLCPMCAVLALISPQLIGIPSLMFFTTFTMAGAISSYILYDKMIKYNKFKEVQEQQKQSEKEEETLEQKQVEGKIKNLNVNSEIKISKAELVRKEKLGKVKNECEINYINNLNAYYVSIPKEDISLQRFIRNEIKKEYPEEKIQSFEVEDKKVLVLSKQPSLFR